MSFCPIQFVFGYCFYPKDQLRGSLAGCSQCSGRSKRLSFGLFLSPAQPIHCPQNEQCTFQTRGPHFLHRYSDEYTIFLQQLLAPSNLRISANWAIKQVVSFSEYCDDGDKETMSKLRNSTEPSVQCACPTGDCCPMVR